MPLSDSPTANAALLIGIVIVAAIALGGLLIYSVTPTATALKNVTVTEKYPSSAAYRSYTYAKIVGDDGTLYSFTNDNLWARFKVNETYTVRWYKLPNDPQTTYINAVTVNGITYYG
jgi:hypothetical protein